MGGERRIEDSEEEKKGENRERRAGGEDVQRMEWVEERWERGGRAAACT